jgi:heptosyltransferase III
MMSRANIQSILIVNIRLIGDVVLTTPLLDVLKAAYPSARIDFLVNKGTGEFLHKDPRVGHVHYSKKWISADGRAHNGYLAAIFRKYDIAICMNASDRGAIAAVAAGRDKRVGFFEPHKKLGSWWRRVLFSHPILYQGDDHVAMRCAKVLEAIGLEAERLSVKVYWDDLDAEIVRSLLEAGGGLGNYFVVHPFARWRYKHWDICRFAELSDMVAVRYDRVPVWTSSPDAEEVELLKTAASHCSVPPILIPGTCTLNQIACLIQGAFLYLGLDTAISHIAASTGVPMLALYGPTEMWRWHPWSNDILLRDYEQPLGRGTFRSGSIVALQAECEHYPCIRPNCYAQGVENPCMMAISARDAFREITGLLDRYTDTV